MFRISEHAGEAGSAILVLEGRFTGQSVDELRRCCEALLTKGRTLTLDVGEVSFVDHQGLAVLRNVISLNAQLVKCPLFLKEQLRDSVSGWSGGGP